MIIKDCLLPSVNFTCHVTQVTVISLEFNHCIRIEAFRHVIELELLD